MEMDINLYDKCNKERQEKNKINEAAREEAANKWSELQKLAAEKGVVLSESDTKLL